MPSETPQAPASQRLFHKLHAPGKLPRGERGGGKALDRVSYRAQPGQKADMQRQRPPGKRRGISGMATRYLRVGTGPSTGAIYAKKSWSWFGSSGAADSPQLPTTVLVMPCASSSRPKAASRNGRKVTMAVLIHKAGGHQTAICLKPREGIGQVGRNAAIRPSFTRMSARAGGRAVPSQTIPPRRIHSSTESSLPFILYKSRPGQTVHPRAATASRVRRPSSHSR